MACRDCGPSVPRLPTEPCRTFTCPLDGADVTITVQGAITPKNLPLVKQYVSFVYDVLEDATKSTPEAV